MSWLKLSLTFSYVLGHLAPNRYELDLSNEVLYTLADQGAAKIFEVKLGGWKKSAGLARPGRIGFESGELAILFSTSNFDLLYFCSLLTCKSEKFLIWKISFIYVWSQKPKAVSWLLMCVMLAQITPISYHTEAKECIFFDAVLF